MTELAQLLKDIKERLLTIKDLKTVQIGQEVGISAQDTPACRIVLMSNTIIQPQQFYDNGDIQIRTFVDMKNNAEEATLLSIDLHQQIRAAIGDLAKFNITYYGDFSENAFYQATSTYNFAGVRNSLADECPADPLAGVK